MSVREHPRYSCAATRLARDVTVKGRGIAASSINFTLITRVLNMLPTPTSFCGCAVCRASATRGFKIFAAKHDMPAIDRKMKKNIVRHTHSPPNDSSSQLGTYPRSGVHDEHRSLRVKTGRPSQQKLVAHKKNDKQCNAALNVNLLEPGCSNLAARRVIINRHIGAASDSV